MIKIVIAGVRRGRSGRRAARVPHADGADLARRFPAGYPRRQSRGRVPARPRRGAAQPEGRIRRRQPLVGTGITGGLSTFSSFAYGIAVLMTASTASAVVASAYVVISLVLGYIAVIVGLKLGRKD